MDVANKYDVIVVGGGIAGLTAAYELSKTSEHMRVAVLEAKNRLGGRTLTISMKAAHGIDQWDIGGQWVGRTQMNIINCLTDLNIPIYPQFTNGRKLSTIFSQIGSETIHAYNCALPFFSWRTFFLTFDLGNYLRKLEQICRRLNLKDLFSDVNRSIELDSLSVSEFAKQNCFTHSVREAVDIGCSSLLGVDSSQVSTLYFAVYANAAGKVVNLFEAIGDGANSMRIKGGSQQVSKRLAEKAEANKVDILLQIVVEKIDQSTAQFEDFPVTVTVRDGACFYCKRVILAIPTCEANKLVYEPLLTEEKRQLLAHWASGNLLKFIVTYSSPFWRQQQFSGEIVASGLTANSERVNPILVTFDATTDNDNAAIVGFLNPFWSSKPMHERREAVLHDLARYFGESALHFIDYQDKNWSEEPFTGGCPVGIVSPGFMKYYALVARTPSGLIHWAGTETATNWIGYMDGAVQSGLRSANEVLYELARDLADVEKLDGSVYHPDWIKPTLPVAKYRKYGLLRRLFKLSVLSIGIAVCFRIGSLIRFESAFFGMSFIRA